MLAQHPTPNPSPTETHSFVAQRTLAMSQSALQTKSSPVRSSNHSGTRNLRWPGVVGPPLVGPNHISFPLPWSSSRILLVELHRNFRNLLLNRDYLGGVSVQTTRTFGRCARAQWRSLSAEFCQSRGTPQTSAADCQATAGSRHDLTTVDC
ncbi:hypothetical protein F8388_021267 [Cannabis sativa]|uniref:Uncharacterized protein n=1 Tax=Cannabis sativa TaxID=3483 RepID=A0A7J6GHS1_CANSA|nr:hypothetical protein F8388_021267 [Cannabis sativa]